MIKAIENGYSIIRILQNDVWYDLNNWQEKLKDAIHTYQTPKCIFLSSNEEYDVYKIQLDENLIIDDDDSEEIVE